MANDLTRLRRILALSIIVPLAQWFAERAQLSKGKLRDVDGQTGSVSSPTYSLKSLSVMGTRFTMLLPTDCPIATTREKKRGWLVTT
jgi:hypothetical protein